MAEGPDGLRAYLRLHTACAHDRLDRTVGALDLARPQDYRRFLRMQRAARGPIELWAAQHCPAELTPPPQSPLIDADLAALGDQDATGAVDFDFPANGDARGVAWALAGSSLGNRAMLHSRRKRGMNRADSFLSDPAMTRFWAGLRPLLEAPAADNEAHAALQAAEAVFRTFQQSADRHLKTVAA